MINNSGLHCLKWHIMKYRGNSWVNAHAHNRANDTNKLARMLNATLKQVRCFGRRWELHYSLCLQIKTNTWTSFTDIASYHWNENNEIISNFVDPHVCVIDVHFMHITSTTDILYEDNENGCIYYDKIIIEHIYIAKHYAKYVRFDC